VGAKAGGNIDLSTRILAKHLEETLGTNVIVDNRPGGGGARMATQLKAARPDGYTLGLNISVTWSFTPHTSRQPAYGLNDFSYIASIARAQEAFVVSTEKPWLTFSEMIDYAKQGNTIVYGSQAPSTRLMMTDIASKAGIKVKILNGKGGQEIIPWLLNGQVDIGFLGGIQEGLVREGKLRVVASTGESRLKHHPDIATLKEQGFTSIPAALFMLAGPKGMDEVIKDRIAQAVGAALTQEDVIALFENRLFLPIEFHGPGELNKILQADDAYFSELLNSKVTADEKS
jgi:tripartite-type tricarboxylate transporter receptor subunit TctC